MLVRREQGVKGGVLTWLGSGDDFDQVVVPQLLVLPARQAINSLFSALCRIDDKMKWRAVRAFGVLVARLAFQDLEFCRVIMRRHMWSLNDESGGIGWGAPEAMAEIIAQSDPLAAEYGHILVSYMRQDGNFLEHEMLQRGLLWGIGRVAETRPALLHAHHTDIYLLYYLDAKDFVVRGRAVRAVGLLGIQTARSRLERLRNDMAICPLYIHPELVCLPVGELARQALISLDGGQPGNGGR